MMATVMFNVR